LTFLLFQIYPLTNNVILLMLLKMIRIFVIFVILLLSLKNINMVCWACYILKLHISILIIIVYIYQKIYIKCRL